VDLGASTMGTVERLVIDIDPSKLKRVPAERRPMMPNPNLAIYFYEITEPETGPNGEKTC
jgi:hypothetical protein